MYQKHVDVECFKIWHVSHFKIFYTESNMKEKCMDHCYFKKKKTSKSNMQKVTFILYYLVSNQIL